MTVRKLVDGFMFYNELDLLQYRLHSLYDVVDFFIISESTHTHAGHPKPLYYGENKHLFEKYQDKIIHVVVEDLPFLHPINVERRDQWENEYWQRNAIARGFPNLTLQDDDYIMISDIDEIPSKSTLELCKKGAYPIEMASLQFDLYYYNLNSFINSEWNNFKILTWKKYKESGFTCEQIRMSRCPMIPKAGWHLSYFGSPEFISNKISNFSHQEFNTDRFTNVKLIEERVKNFTDIYDRHDQKLKRISVKENPFLPPEYEVYLKNYYSF
jgi:beta-1,4-mannosyl-glycoprotein beta-1,4-N-acetylglucosaminyltransferase